MSQDSFGTKVKRTTKKVLLLLIVVAIGVFAFFYWAEYADEQRSGTVLRIGKRGMLFKTYEGQLNLQTFGSLKRANPFVEAFDFSVASDNEQVIKDLQEVALTGEYISLHYIRRYARFPWRGETKVFVTKVERLGHSEPPVAPNPPQAP